MRGGHYLPNKDDFWRSPPYEALREIVLRTAYHDALKIIMEHDYTFLFSDVMCNEQAPMPHVVYEDFMKVLTFCSRQRPPEEQFALPDNILRDLLCWAAYYCTLDPFYFTSASMFFRKVEQEQHLSPALHSAWVYICTAAGKIDEALAYAVYMDQHRIDFDPAVFALMLHPSLTPGQLHLRHVPQTAKGIVLQRRLCQDMQQHHSTTPVAVHAMFVYHVLTLRHTRKWEVLRAAAEWSRAGRQQHDSLERARRGRSPATRRTADAAVAGPVVSAEVMSPRTVQLAMALCGREKAVRWGPRTTKAMVFFMLSVTSAGATTADVVFVLLRIRRNERTALLAGLPRAVFNEAEQEELMAVVRRRSRVDPACAVAAPLLRELFAAGSTTSSSNSEAAVEGTASLQQQHGSDDGIMRALQDLQKLSMSAANRNDDDSSHTQYMSTARRISSEPVSSAGATYDEMRRREEATLLEDDAAVYPLTSPLASGVHELSLPQPADVARELLEAVMALDRASTQQDAATNLKAASFTTAGADTSANSNVAAASSSSSSSPPGEQLAALHASLEAMGTSASLSTWSAQQVEEEAEEARLRAQVSTAWIAPTYRP
ncbi:putative mitochondrial hypothetical protein [Leptomonas pyrrhocoris]|uniref:Uncharacterized protein n=1 Tax=Leptomonas pyrrhocoris TaxID=157538 RepID=A0A0M9FSS6_LEPPY|nr:putative mitochondrial hypothetical protein [Leptomonas pyrrhocoris]KPA75293.1 putative mitochondrial hypothetical protein [Leptomonas pyrrhocoris]|eukprot:XP_015653732.1 putative mitochondrial hypothetical protein [Leptomonas pyrrhocoris]